MTLLGNYSPFRVAAFVLNAITNENNIIIGIVIDNELKPSLPALRFLLRLAGLLKSKALSRGYI